MAINPAVRSVVLRASLVALSAVVLWAGYTGFRVWRAWENVERVAFETEAARDALEAASNPFRTGEDPVETSDADVPQEPILTEGSVPVIDPGSTIEEAVADARIAPGTLQTFLVIGSDERAETGASRRADVILMVMLPADSPDPIMVSIPRDLYLPNPCTGGMSRINANLNGCGDIATGPEQLAIAVEDFTGIQVDHFAVFDFEGFKAIVERVGGVEICVDTPVRDLNVKPVALDLPAGCTVAQADQALAWVRSRKTEEFVNGAWRRMSGVNDLSRNQRQQEFLIQALLKLKGFRSVTEFSGLVEDVTDAFTIDDGLSIGEAVSTVWDMRSIDPNGIIIPTIAVADFITSGGQYVLLPQNSFQEILSDVYPQALDLFANAGE